MKNEKKQKIPRICLYCEYWNGVRDGSPDSPEVSRAPDGTPGQCENEESVFFNQDREKTDSCRRFLKCREE